MIFVNFRRYKVTNDGVVALITTIIVSLLLVVITTSAVALMAGELRQASDFDQSTKAYFAAEAGIEDAIAEIRRRMNRGESLATIVSSGAGCPAFIAGDENLGGNIVYTCQLVSTTANSVTAALQPEQTASIDLAGISVSSVVISWNQVGSDNPADSWNIPANFPSEQGAADWSIQNPAVIEASLIEYPDSSISADTIDISTAVLKPVRSEIPTSLSFSSIPENGAAALRDIACNPNAGQQQYNCSVTITGLSTSSNYVMRLRTRYARANYKVEAFNSSNVLVPIPDAQLAIDVTGRAGNDIFRRILLKIPLSDQPAVNFVILADEKICKFFEVIGTAANSETGCTN